MSYHSSTSTKWSLSLRSFRLKFGPQLSDPLSLNADILIRTVIWNPLVYETQILVEQNNACIIGIMFREEYERNMKC